MLREEDSLRRSEAVQQEMEKAERSADSEWMEVAAQVQTRVVVQWLALKNQAPMDQGQVEGQGQVQGPVQGQKQGPVAIARLTPTSSATTNDYHVQRGLLELRRAATRHPELAFYVRYNRYWSYLLTRLPIPRSPPILLFVDLPPLSLGVLLTSSFLPTLVQVPQRYPQGGHACSRCAHGAPGWLTHHAADRSQ
mmetsp:Transcript_14492/g.31934  ORF Transcript_14492/g.31934 Transcript_14492/m.31934 type:complete len:194 (-) Transcript_14492:762-1343(-)